MLLKPFMREGTMPLPVTFISTISRDGVRNISPWSCVMPILRPLDLICAAPAKKRDTLVNIRETGEFVLNLAGAGMQDKVIPTARYSSPDVEVPKVEKRRAEIPLKTGSSTRNEQRVTSNQ